MTFPGAKRYFLILKKSYIFLHLFAKCFLTTIWSIFLELPIDKWSIDNPKLPIIHSDRMKNSLLFSIFILIFKSIPETDKFNMWNNKGHTTNFKEASQNQ